MPEITDPTLLAKLNAGRKAAPVITLPDPRADVRDDIAVQGAGNDQIRTGIAERGEGREIGKTAFDQTTVYRKEYDGQPAVKVYREAMPSLKVILGTAPNGAGDQDLIYNISKMRDPLGAVRESDVSLTQSGQSFFDRSYMELQKQLADSNGEFTPEFRAQLRAEAIKRGQAYNEAYNQQRERYIKYAQADNFDPFKVVGEHDGARVLPAFTDYDRKNQIGRFAPGQVNRPDMTGGLPTGTDATFADQDGGGFDRGAYLRSLGIDPNQEASVMAFYNANRGNENLTAEEVLKFYADLGARAPDPATILQQVSDARAGKAFGPIDTSQAEAEYRARVSQAADTYGLVTGESDYGERFQSGATMGLQDELAGVGGGISALLQGENPTDAYRFQRDVQRERYRQADENTGLTGDLTEIGSSMLVPFGAATTPIRAAKIGAMSGALGGFGYGEGAKDSLGQAALLAAGGAGAGYGLSKIAEGAGALKNKLFPTKAADETPIDIDALRMASEAENVPVNRAMADPRLANKVTATESTLAGGPKIRAGMQDVSNKIKGRVDELGQGGSAIDPDVVGGRVQSAIRSTDNSMKARTDRLYDKYRSASGNPKVSPEKALQQVDTELAELAKSPKTNSGEIKYLEDLKSDLSSGELDVDTLLNVRRSMRGQISERNLGLSQAEARVQRVVEAAGDDIAAVLDPKSEAYKLLQAANKAHGERQIFKRELYKELVGTDRDLPTDPEEVFKKIMSWTKPGGKNGKVISLWNKLPEEDARDFAASIASRVGRDAGGNFSPDRFITQIQAMTPKVRATIFGPKGEASIQNLLKLADAHKRVTGTFNHSKSGVAINSSGMKQAALTAIGATGGGYAGGYTGMAVGAGLASTMMAKNYLTANMLMNSNVTKWAAALAKKPNPQAAKAHVMRLSNIAKSEPYIGAEIINLKDYLLKQLAESPQRAAAQDQTASLPQSANTNTEGEGR